MSGGSWPEPSLTSPSLPSCLPRLERLQRIVSKLQMESGLCEEQLNQADTLLQSVRCSALLPLEPREPRSGREGLAWCCARLRVLRSPPAGHPSAECRQGLTALGGD